jgi:hypothetical protein
VTVNVTRGGISNSLIQDRNARNSPQIRNSATTIAASSQSLYIACSFPRQGPDNAHTIDRVLSETMLFRPRVVGSVRAFRKAVL